MQAIKEKLSDMSHMRKAKADAREEEREEKEMAKTRVQVAKEIRMAREAEAAMDLHVSKAAEKVAQQEAKCAHNLENLDSAHQLPPDDSTQDPSGHNYNSTTAATGGAANDPAGSAHRDYSKGTHSLI